MNTPIRLSDLAHGGGCGCKLAPAVLHDLLSGSGVANAFPNLLVGLETGDDAAVWRIDDKTCIIATTDFFTPVVDDPFDFGRIAATNAISDVYAMGGQPIMALALLGMPLGKIDHDVVRRILEGGRSVCASAGIPVAGGHSIDSPELIYGLVVIGTCHPDDIKRNCNAVPGDALILTKPLGVGVYSAAFKKQALSPQSYDEFLMTTTLLNTVGRALAKDRDVHAMTDVTGFGLFGHALEMARGSNCTVAIESHKVPRLAEAERLIDQGYVTGASSRNWKSYGDSVQSSLPLSDVERHLFTDPQTSGGLLIACAPAKIESIMGLLAESGYQQSAVIGCVEQGPPRIAVRT